MNAPPGSGPLPAPPSFVPPADVQTYSQLFAASAGNDFRARIPANAARAILVKSGVANEVLARIWGLADTSSTGALTFAEFCLAMALVKRAMESPANVPPTLPHHIRNEIMSLNIQLGVGAGLGASPAPSPAPPMPSSFSGSALGPASVSASSSLSNLSALAAATAVPAHLPKSTSAGALGAWTSSSGASVSLPRAAPGSQVGSGTGLAMSAMTVPGIMASLATPPTAASTARVPTGEWLISHDEKLKYLSLFKSWDSAGVGYLSGEQCREIFATAGLPQNILQHIWSLADIHNAGKLNSDEFAIAMHLIYKKLSNVDLPSTLPPGLVPSSQKDLDNSVSFMKDRLMQQMLIEKMASANSPAWVIDLQRVLRSLKAQYEDKLRSGIVLPDTAGPTANARGAREREDMVRTILTLREKLNGILLKVFKLRDMKKYKYAPIPEQSSINISSLLHATQRAPGSPATLASATMSEEERRKQKAAEMLAQRMAALNVTSDSASGAKKLSSAQEEAKLRIQAESDRLTASYRELEGKLKALSSPESAQELLGQFQAKLAVIAELLRPVELPEVPPRNLCLLLRLSRSRMAPRP
ncbi:actin organization and endocytosis protein [Blastocladiella emersonii ATCC 22665]|nr:actin organization and endocytosis protein [Blastocladiella emersonii ATCC 22665]